MCKFKIGDKVRRTGYNHRQVVRGEIYTVVEYVNQKGLILEGLADYGYSDYNFELVEENMNKQFTKDMLVAGKHVVELRDGSKQLVLIRPDSEIFFVNLNGENMFHDISGLKDNLTWYSVVRNMFTVTKVYEILNPTWFNNLGNNLKLIWQREEKSQSQIELEKLQKQISELQDQAKRLEKSL